jgi:hypothetical protein
MQIKCPGCGSKDVRCSRSDGLLSSLLRRLVLHPFRCRSCRKRFFRSGQAAVLQASKHRLRRFGYMPLHQNLAR